MEIDKRQEQTSGRSGSAEMTTAWRWKAAFKAALDCTRAGDYDRARQWLDIADAIYPPGE